MKAGDMKHARLDPLTDPAAEILSLTDLFARGWSHHEVRRAVRGGRLVRLRRGQYALAAGLTPWAGHARLARAVAASTGTGAALSHESAAVLLGIAVSPARLGRVHLTRVDEAHGKTVGGALHHAGPLEPGDLVEIGGTPCVAPARTAVDLARTAPYPWGVAAIDSALYLELATPETIAAEVDRAAGRSGVERCRAAAAFADGHAESALESLSRVRLAELRLPPPTLQYEFREGKVVVARFDFAWPDLRLAGEADGAIKYRDGRADERPGVEVLLDEKARTQRVHELGWRIVRWDHDTLDNPIRFERRVRSAFAEVKGRAAS